MLNIKLLGFLSVVFVTFAVTGCSDESKQTMQDSASSISDTVSE